MPEEDDVVVKRAADAAGYFIKQLDEIVEYIKQSPAITDSRQHAKSYNDALKELFVLLAEKKHLLNSCLPKFSISNYYTQKKNFVVPGLSPYWQLSALQNPGYHK